MALRRILLLSLLVLAVQFLQIEALFLQLLYSGAIKIFELWTHVLLTVIIIEFPFAFLYVIVLTEAGWPVHEQYRNGASQYAVALGDSQFRQIVDTILEFALEDQICGLRQQMYQRGFLTVVNCDELMDLWGKPNTQFERKREQVTMILKHSLYGRSKRKVIHALVQSFEEMGRASNSCKEIARQIERHLFKWNMIRNWIVLLNQLGCKVINNSIRIVKSSVIIMIISLWCKVDIVKNYIMRINSLCNKALDSAWETVQRQVCQGCSLKVFEHIFGYRLFPVWLLKILPLRGALMVFPRGGPVMPATLENLKARIMPVVAKVLLRVYSNLCTVWEMGMSEMDTPSVFVQPY